MPDPSGPELGAQVWPSLSVKEILHVGEVAVSSAAKARPVCTSVKPIGSESITTCVGPGRFAHVAVAPPPLAGLSLKLINSDSRSDWKLVTPFAELSDFQFTPIDGSPALRPIHSTVGPVVTVTGVITPGASKFSYPILLVVSMVAAGGGSGVRGTTVAEPWYWSPGTVVK